MARQRRPKGRQRTLSGTRKRLRFVLDTRGRALVIIGIILVISAYTVHRSELLYLGSLLVGLPILAIAFLRFRRRKLGISRRFTPAIAVAGQPVAVSVDVRNLASTRTGESAWRDEWPWAPFGTPAARLTPLERHRGLLGASGTTVVDYVLHPPRRGVFDVGPLVVGVSDPFALARGEIIVGGVQKLIVTPRVVVLPVSGQSIAADEGTARAMQRRNTGGGDDLMTREYRHGDPLRRVHWKATARQGELMVRLEEQRSHAQARIILDTRRAGYRDAVDRSSNGQSSDEPESDSFEWAVAFTASLTFHLQSIGFTVEVIETGHQQVTLPDRQEEFLESLAAISLVDGPDRRKLVLLPDPGRSLGSVFAIVADAEAHTLETLVTQRGLFDSAVAFIVNPHNEFVIGPLRDSGWLCIAVRPTDDLAAVWRAAIELREANRARA